MPEFYMIIARKIIKIPEFLHFCPKKFNKIPEFYMIGQTDRQTQVML